MEGRSAVDKRILSIYLFISLQLLAMFSAVSSLSPVSIHILISLKLHHIKHNLLAY